jgi:glycosyltransferase involved in cell wall biosynthesis
MRVSVFIEQRFIRLPDGSVWVSGVYGVDFWERYLSVYDNVVVVARVKDVPIVPQGFMRCDGKRVRFFAIPHYRGPWEYAKFWWKIRHAVRRAALEADGVILRVPSALACHAFPVFRKKLQPFGVEVVGDPFDMFARDSVRHPLWRFFRWLFTLRLRQICAKACGAAYVTREALQRRYPCLGYSLGVSDVNLPVQAFITNYSSIQLKSRAFARVPRTPSNGAGGILIYVGSLEELYKGADVLIHAFHQLIQEGVDARLVLVGDGRYRRVLEERCNGLEINGKVTFCGQLPSGERVRAELDNADIFVLPSRQEGLPRAMVEAMARGLPCIGSSVGGIPELLPPEDMVPPGDARALASKMKEVISNPVRMGRMSVRNLEVAKEYREEILQPRRVSFYEFQRKQTELWMKATGHL